MENRNYNFTIQENDLLTARKIIRKENREVSRKWNGPIFHWIFWIFQPRNWPNLIFILMIGYFYVTKVAPEIESFLKPYFDRSYEFIPIVIILGIFVVIGLLTSIYIFVPLRDFAISLILKKQFRNSKAYRNEISLLLSEKGITFDDVFIKWKSIDACWWDEDQKLFLFYTKPSQIEELLRNSENFFSVDWRKDNFTHSYVIRDYPSMYLMVPARIFSNKNALLKYLPKKVSKREMQNL